MIQLVSRTLSGDSQQHLDKLQQKVNDQAAFIHKAAKAKTLWDGKKKLVALVAAYLNEIRLIDNIIL